MITGTNILPITLPDVEVQLPPSSAALAMRMDTDLTPPLFCVARLL